MTGKAVTTPQRNHAKAIPVFIKGSTDFIYRTISTCRNDMRVILMLSLLHDPFACPAYSVKRILYSMCLYACNMPYPVRNLPAQTETPI